MERPKRKSAGNSTAVASSSVTSNGCAPKVITRCVFVKSNLKPHYCFVCICVCPCEYSYTICLFPFVHIVH